MSIWKSLAPLALTIGGAAVGGPLGGAVGGGLGGAIAGEDKHQQELDRQHRTAELASATARYSPWTHMTPNSIQWANPDTDAIGGGALAGAASGWGMGTSMGAMKTPTPVADTLAKPELGASALPQSGGFLGVNTDLGGAPAQGYNLGANTGGGFGSVKSPWQTMWGNNNQYSYNK